MSSSFIAHFLEIHAAAAGLAVPVADTDGGFVIRLDEGIVVRAECRGGQIVLMGSPGAADIGQLIAGCRMTSGHQDDQDDDGDDEDDESEGTSPNVLVPCAGPWLRIKENTQPCGHGKVRICVSADPVDGLVVIGLAAPLAALDADALDAWMFAFREAYLDCEREIQSLEASADEKF